MHCEVWYDYVSYLGLVQAAGVMFHMPMYNKIVSMCVVE